MGVNYSAAICYGFAVKESDIPYPEDGGVSEYLSEHGIGHAWAGSFYSGNVWIVLCVRGTHTNVNFYDEPKPITELSQSAVITDSVLDLQVRCEKAGIDWKEPEWLLTTLIS